MPNWVEQDFEIVGPKPDLDRFLKKALFVPTSAVDRGRYGGPIFRLTRAYKPPTREAARQRSDAPERKRNTPSVLNVASGG